MSQTLRSPRRITIDDLQNDVKRADEERREELKNDMKLVEQRDRQLIAEGRFPHIEPPVRSDWWNIRRSWWQPPKGQNSSPCQTDKKFVTRTRSYKRYLYEVACKEDFKTMPNETTPCMQRQNGQHNTKLAAEGKFIMTPQVEEEFLKLAENMIKREENKRILTEGGPELESLLRSIEGFNADRMKYKECCRLIARPYKHVETVTVRPENCPYQPRISNLLKMSTGSTFKNEGVCEQKKKVDSGAQDDADYDEDSKSELDDSADDDYDSYDSSDTDYSYISDGDVKRDQGTSSPNEMHVLEKSPPKDTRPLEQIPQRNQEKRNEKKRDQEKSPSYAAQYSGQSSGHNGYPQTNGQASHQWTRSPPVLNGALPHTVQAKQRFEQSPTRNGNQQPNLSGGPTHVSQRSTPPVQAAQHSGQSSGQNGYPQTNGQASHQWTRSPPVLNGTLPHTIQAVQHGGQSSGLNGYQQTNAQAKQRSEKSPARNGNQQPNVPMSRPSDGSGSSSGWSDGIDWLMHMVNVSPTGYRARNTSERPSNGANAMQKSGQSPVCNGYQQASGQAAQYSGQSSGLNGYQQTNAQQSEQSPARNGYHTESGQVSPTGYRARNTSERPSNGANAMQKSEQSPVCNGYQQASGQVTPTGYRTRDATKGPSNGANAMQKSGQPPVCNGYQQASGQAVQYSGPPPGYNGYPQTIGQVMQQWTSSPPVLNGALPHTIQVLPHCFPARKGTPPPMKQVSPTGYRTRDATKGPSNGANAMQKSEQSPAQNGYQQMGYETPHAPFTPNAVGISIENKPRRLGGIPNAYPEAYGPPDKPRPFTVCKLPLTQVKPADIYYNFNDDE